MKILHITDSHGTVKSPEGRTDIYYLSFLKKMYELKYVIKQNDIKLIIHTGDLFHSPRVSDKFAGQLSEIIKSYGIPMYVVPGNHDMDGYTINTLDQTKLGLLYKTGVVKELDREKNPIQLKSQKENLNISIAGQEYYKDIDTGNMTDFEMRNNNPNADFNILAIHGYLCDSPQHPNIRCTQCKDIVTDADVILSGHYHRSFIYKDSQFSVYNPGSMMRTEQTEYNKTHIPQYGILTITKDQHGTVSHNYELFPFKVAEPSDKVFDYNTQNRKKKTLITLENFKNSIANTNLNTNLNTSIEKIINDVSHNMMVTQDVIDKSIDVYHAALNNSPDKLEVQAGFIADTNKKYIESVTIHNFQSHENTYIEFKQGLNVITGESNSGKTSILRAIRWCLDNDPLGSDFITTGNDECKVTVKFNDGTLISRKRTRNDSGTYKVIGKTLQPDGTVSYWSDMYRGFANNVPVEVANIHQMPKVNLTKDLCTHLNMMSQLDGPFLVADSPQVRAAVIGRLTGTQIIDLGIKESNKIILGNSKSIKTYSGEREELVNELKKLDYLPNYDQVVKHYETIINYCEKEYNTISNISDLCDTAYEEIRTIKAFEDEISYYNTKIKVCRYTISIYSYIAENLKILDLYSDRNNVVQEINNLERKIKWLTVLCSLKFLATNAQLKLNEYVTIKRLSDNIDNVNKCAKQSIIQKDISNEKILLLTDIKKNYIHIYNYINVLAKDISNTKPLLDSVMNYQKKILSQESAIKQLKVDCKVLNNQIKDLTQMQEQYILTNNICPCCGQKITQDHIDNIKIFMNRR